VNWVTQFNGLLHPGDPPRPEIQPWFPVAQQSPLTGLLRDLHWDGVDHIVLTAFVERWTPKTNSFHFFFGELTITLHDVYCLFGLPIEGRVCVAPRRIDRLEIIQLFSLPPAQVTSTTFHQGLAFERIQEWVLAGGEVEAGRRGLIASGMLSILAAGTLFIDKGTNKVRIDILSMFMDVEASATYAWATGVLYCLYRGLGEATRSGAQQLDGCPLLLMVSLIYLFISTYIFCTIMCNVFFVVACYVLGQAWIGAYFPRLYVQRPDLARSQDPRFAARYLEYRTPPRATGRLGPMRLKIDSLTERDVSIFYLVYLRTISR
jgi:Plant mobile domain